MVRCMQLQGREGYMYAATKVSLMSRHIEETMNAIISMNNAITPISLFETKPFSHYKPKNATLNNGNIAGTRLPGFEVKE